MSLHLDIPHSEINDHIGNAMVRVSSLSSYTSFTQNLFLQNQLHTPPKGWPITGGAYNQRISAHLKNSLSVVPSKQTKNLPPIAHLLALDYPKHLDPDCDSCLISTKPIFVKFPEPNQNIIANLVDNVLLSPIYYFGTRQDLNLHEISIASEAAILTGGDLLSTYIPSNKKDQSQPDLILIELDRLLDINVANTYLAFETNWRGIRYLLYHYSTICFFVGVSIFWIWSILITISFTLLFVWWLEDKNLVEHKEPTNARPLDQQTRPSSNTSQPFIGRTDRLRNQNESTNNESPPLTTTSSLSAISNEISTLPTPMPSPMHVLETSDTDLGFESEESFRSDNNEIEASGSNEAESNESEPDDDPEFIETSDHGGLEVLPSNSSLPLTPESTHDSHDHDQSNSNINTSINSGESTTNSLFSPDPQSALPSALSTAPIEPVSSTSDDKK